MTDRRLQAWARIAFEDAQPSWAYLTTSAAVFDHLKGLGPEVVELAVWHLYARPDNEDLRQRRQTAIGEIGRAKNLDAMTMDPVLSDRCTDDAVPMVLAGLPGSLFETILAGPFFEKMRPRGKASTAQDWHNTVIGLVGRHSDIDGK